jgi:hypothetical protein
MRVLRLWRERLNHEYWPWPLIYLPVFPVALWHAVRTGRGAFFTNVNPGIDLGGFFGERKSEIFARLPRSAYPTTLLVEPGTPFHVVEGRMREVQLTLPLIMKPDVGERGTGVMVVRDTDELRALLSDTHQPQLLQELVTWPAEFGLMFVKDPTSQRTTLLSITAKTFLSVTGDGRSSVEDLLKRTWRGTKQVQRLRKYRKELLDSIPGAGEGVVVEPIGNHCRGTVFRDGRGLATAELERAVDGILARAEGIHYGRLDVRSPNEEALKQGRFLVMELNGVTSEPGHIYDPSFTIFQCWKELLRHVAHIPPLSDALRSQDHQPVSFRVLRDRYRSYFKTAP